MERRYFLKAMILVTGSVLFACKQTRPKGQIHYLEPQLNSRLTLEGEVVHVCPIQGKKMKLKLDDGEIMKVTSTDGTPFEATQWNNKRVRITGKLGDLKLSRKEIADTYADKKLLCHIDHTPCIDTRWVNNRWQDGSGNDILQRDNEALQLKMRQTENNYIQVFTITAEKIELL